MLLIRQVFVGALWAINVGRGESGKRWPLVLFFEQAIVLYPL
jgi:hypothetical protein